MAVGGVSGGFSLFLRDGRPVFEYNNAMVRRDKIAGSEKLLPGPNAVGLEFIYDGGGLGKGGGVSLFINNKKVGTGRLPFTNWVKFSLDETFDIGQDSGSPVSEDYVAPNRFGGTIKKVVIDTQPAKLSAADRQRILHMERAAKFATE